MKSLKWFGVLAPLAFTVAATVGGCGQDVATCGTVCDLPGAPTQNCNTTCTATEAACATQTADPNCSGDFQLLLTCLDNAGTYDAINGLCESIAARVSAESSTPNGTPSDAGTPSSCSSATCSSVCATDGTQAASCADGCDLAQSQCSSLSEQYQALLTCLCESGGVTSAAASACAAEADALSSCMGVQVGSGVGGGTGVGPGVGTGVGGSSGSGVGYPGAGEDAGVPTPG